MPHRCRDCKYWYPIPPWQGNCKLRPTDKPQWSDSAMPDARGCNAYEPKYIPGPNGCLVKAR